MFASNICVRRSRYSRLKKKGKPPVRHGYETFSCGCFFCFCLRFYDFSLVQCAAQRCGPAHRVMLITHIRILLVSRKKYSKRYPSQRLTSVHRAEQMFDRFVLMCVRVHLRLLRRSCVLLIKLVFGSFLVPVRVPSPSAQVELEVLLFFLFKEGR